MKKYLSASAIALLMTGCMVGPNYKRPDIQTPTVFRGATAAQLSGENSIAETKWRDLFDDEALRQLVDTALKQNFDLRIAAERVQEARAQFDSRKANLFPFLNGQAQWNATRSSTIGSLPFVQRNSKLQYSYTQLGAAASWELDLWGRLRRMNESARAQFLATEENQLAVRMALVAEVMNTYFTLLEQDRELAIAKQTKAIADDGLRLTTLRRDKGSATGLDVHQAEQLMYTATARIAEAEREIAQTENAMSLLLGQTPGDIARGGSLEKIARPGELRAGTPASLVARRPDIRRAEQQLISANAEIGAARAQYFPQLSLNAFLGAQSRALTEIFTSPALQTSITPSALAPIFRAGQIRAGVRVTEAQQREALLTYQQTIYVGLRDASDALVANDRIRQQVKEQNQLVTALGETKRLSQLRYTGGLDSYLQVLDADRNLFQGQLALAQLQMLELQSVVRLYSALGGGWN